jgi:hypothetical protein
MSAQGIGWRFQVTTAMQSPTALALAAELVNRGADVTG